MLHARLRFCWFAVVAVGLLLPAAAEAHFLFIRVGPHAEAGRAVEVFFSEYATAGDPRFIGRVAHTRLWQQAAPGEFRELTVREAADRLRATVPTGETAAIVGECEWGVLKREVPFLLQYYPKALLGDPDELNQLKPRPEAPAEITARFSDDGVTLTLLHNGRPVPNATLTTVDDDLVNEELKTDDSGQVTWKPESPGHYCVYTKITVDEAGDKDGEHYTEIRMFPTLAFHWPATRSDADPAAVGMFQRAIATRATWNDFPGFTAQIAGSVDGRDFSGDMKVDANGSVEIEISDDAVYEWVEDQLNSLVMHRLRQDDDGTQPVLQFADDAEDHALGRLLTFVGGHFASSYRVKDDQITVVNRNLGKQNMTITVLDNQPNEDGQFLPHSYVVQYWDANTGDLLRAQTFQNRWQRLGNIDLPSELTVTEASAAGLSVRNITLSEHKLGAASEKSE